MPNFLLVAQFLPCSYTSITMSLWLNERDIYFLLHDLRDTGQKAGPKRAEKKNLVLSNCTHLLTIKA